MCRRIHRPRLGAALAFAALAWASPRAAVAQSILTIAGGGEDDGRPAAEASLRVPHGVAAAKNGDVLVADTFDDRIRVVDARTGDVSTLAGNGERGGSGDGGPASLAGLDNPTSVAVDAAGNVYIADSGNQKIRRVDPAGKITTFAGRGPNANGLGGFSGDGGPAAAAELSGPEGVAVDGAGNVYVADTLNHRVRRVAVSGVIDTIAGDGTAAFAGDGGPALAASLRSPRGLAFSAGALFVADTGNACVRRIDLASGIITTLAGRGAETADGVAASSAKLLEPRSVSVDASGGLLIADAADARVRRVALATGLIATLAGTGAGGFSGDGGPAVEARLAGPRGVAALADGSVLVADTGNNRVRAVSASGRITTLAGTGTRGLIGDGGPATSAGLAGPKSVAFDADGGLLIADEIDNRIRRVSPLDGVISTLVGSGAEGSGPEGAPGTESALNRPFGVALGPSGDVYFSDTLNHRVRKLSRATGIVTTVAGTGVAGLSGEGGPAIAATLREPRGIAVDAAGDVFIADAGNHAIRRVSAASGLITRVAGTGAPGSQGDGGPASSATFTFPSSVALDGARFLYVADTGDAVDQSAPGGHRIRRIDLVAGTISTAAGTGVRGAGGDGGPATAARIGFPYGVAVDAAGNVLVADTDGSAIRRVDAASGIITTIAGGRRGFFGDRGPATSAGLQEPYGVLAGASGDVYIADKSSNRVRVVYACRSVAAPAPAAPEDGAVDPSPVLTFTAVRGAFRYDVLLDTVNPPVRVVAADLGATTVTPDLVPPGATYVYGPANLERGVRYFWRVVAKGDPFCGTPASAASAVRSFTAGTACGEIALAAPGDGASGLAAPVVLSWSAAGGAASYDVFLGPADPPPLYAAGVASTTLAVPSLASGTEYFWRVAARAACGAVSSRVSRFAVGGACAAPGALAAQEPANGASGVGARPVLRWTASPNAASYDVYLGTADPPPLYAAGVPATELAVGPLASGGAYLWRVTARSACDPARESASATSRFTVSSACAAPGRPAIAASPAGPIERGRTYAVSWLPADGLGPDGSYVVERSLSSGFATLLDAQTVREPSAAFVAAAAGDVYHRVRAVASCGAGAGPDSEPVRVEVRPARANVIVTAPPRGVLVPRGARLEDARPSFVLENLGDEDARIDVEKWELGSVPFFALVDPEGRDARSVALPRRAPRRLGLRFSGPPSGADGSYQGLVFPAAREERPVAYGFVNLRVGSSSSGATPFFRVAGKRAESAAFAPFAGSDDAARAPLEVEIVNPGSARMELTAEVGPELWLELPADWNSAPIEPGSSRTLRLRTDRRRAPNGSALPRYTYLTVRTGDDRTARLLVRDDGAVPVRAGRGIALAPSAPSYVVPSVVHATSRIGHTFTSKLWLANAGTEPVAATLVFTPAGADGLDRGRVSSAAVAVPGDDVAAIEDPLVSLFGLTPPVSGSLEVRAPEAALRALTVTSKVEAPGESGTFGFAMPTVRRGDGVAAGRPHVLCGITSTPAYRTNLILAETTGLDAVSVRVRLLTADADVVGERVVVVPRSGQAQISGLFESFGGTGTLEAGRVELEAASGAGAAAAVATVIDNTNDDAVAYQSRPVLTAPASRRPGAAAQAAATTVRVVVPSVVSGFPTFKGRGDLPYTFRSLLGLSSMSGSPATFQISYVDLERGGATTTKTVTVGPRRTREMKNVLAELFGVLEGQRSQGPMFIDASLNGSVYCKVYSELANGTLGDAFPVAVVGVDALSGAGSSVPLAVDGLEQSVDESTGTRSNLILNEVLGQGAVVDVRLYEAGNRSVPIAEAELTLAPWEKRQLSTVFDALSMNTPDRRKDRTNVLCVVTARSGGGLVSAVVTTIDNATGDTKNSLLTPVGATSSPASVVGF